MNLIPSMSFQDASLVMAGLAFLQLISVIFFNKYVEKFKIELPKYVKHS